MSKNNTWPSIGTLSDWILKTADTNPKPVVRSKIKLHGTNGSIVFESGKKPIARKRGGRFKDDADNFGFQGWVKASFSDDCNMDSSMIIFGEWAGNGINAKDHDAVSKLGFKAFFVFSILKNDQWIIERSGDLRTRFQGKPSLE